MNIFEKIHASDKCEITSYILALWKTAQNNPLMLDILIK